MPYLAHTILNVSNFERSKQFYDSLMEALDVPSRIVHDGDEIKIIAYQIPHAPIYLRWARDETKQKFVRNVGLDHLCIGVEKEEVVDKVYQRLSNEADTIITVTPKHFPDYTPDYYAFYFRDPDGIPLEVAYIA